MITPSIPPPVDNEKSTVDELIKAYKAEKDADVARRTMPVIHVEHDG